MPTFKVKLSRKIGDIVQSAVTVVTAKSKKLAGDIALVRAEENDGKVEWTPVLADGVQVPDDAEIAVDDVEMTDANGGGASGTNGNVTTDKPEGGHPVGKDGSTPPGVSGGIVRGVPDVPVEKSLQAQQVDAQYGTSHQKTQDQLDAEAQGRRDDAPPAKEERGPRAQSDPALDAPPGCGGVKNAMGNADNRASSGQEADGRLLDVHSGDRHADGAKPEGALETAQEQQHATE